MAAAVERKIAGAGGLELGEVGGAGGGVDGPVGGGEVVGRVLGIDGDGGGAEPVRGAGGVGVAASDGVSEGVEEVGEPGHPDAPGADCMDADGRIIDQLLDGGVWVRLDRGGHGRAECTARLGAKGVKKQAKHFVSRI